MASPVVALVNFHENAIDPQLFQEGIAKLPSNRQNAASEDEERKRSVVTTLSLSNEAIAPRREGGWDESFAIPPSSLPFGYGTAVLNFSVF
ncbi:MAG: hypothetical protein IJJ26_11375 [Victivallales bacterium]|nr:hypothetical protein [Victivallales bacterium]